MIKGIGVDIVEIARFAQWHTFSHAQLRRIFSEQEIDYCLSVPAKSAERFAVRFAAREALFKALCQAGLGVPIPFLTLCAAVQVSHAPSGAPELIVDWPALPSTPCGYVGHSRGFSVVEPALDSCNSVGSTLHSFTLAPRSCQRSGGEVVRVLLSLSHANTVAIAMVVLE
jgi:phosphopantetheine--protein transferase-like protein